MISHDNIIYATAYLFQTAKMKFASERAVSYLPLSHIAAQIIDCFALVFSGGTLFYAQPDALKGSLFTTVAEIKPTVFFGVPRVWEKAHEKIEQVVSSQSKLKKSIFNWATKTGYDYIQAKFRGRTEKNIKYWFAKKLVLQKIHKNLGFDQCRLFYSGAAPINKRTIEFFLGLGIPLCEVFGMSECTGPHIIALAENNRVGCVGYSKNKFNATKIVSCADYEDNGELCLYGRHVMMGYMNNEEKTAEAIDKDGYLHTGDIANVDDNGFLYITGRLKELIITAGGENISPVAIEDAIKNELTDCVSNCMLVGDRKKYLTVLVTLKVGF